MAELRWFFSADLILSKNVIVSWDRDTNILSIYKMHCAFEFSAANAQISHTLERPGDYIIILCVCFIFDDTFAESGQSFKIITFSTRLCDAMCMYHFFPEQKLWNNTHTKNLLNEWKF